MATLLDRIPSAVAVTLWHEFVFQIRVRREEGPLPDLRILNLELGRGLVGVGRRGYECPADEARRLLVS